MTEKETISRFNALNGKIVSVKQLRQMVQDIDRSGVNGTIVKSIRERLQKAIALASSKRISSPRLKFIPVAIPVEKAIVREKKPVALPVKETHHKTSGKKDHHAPAAGSQRGHKGDKGDKGDMIKKDRSPLATAGPQSAASRKANTYKPIELHGPFKEDLTRMNSDAQVMVWGLPGEGKTGYCLKLANSLAKHSHLKVLYVAAEEYERSTFDEKLEALRAAGTPIDDENLFFCASLDKVDLRPYDVILLDSVQKCGMKSLEDYITFAKRMSGKVIISIIQSTKDGDFRGGKDWEHEMDIAGEVIGRRLLLRKNRYDPMLASKRKKKMMDSMVEKEREKKKIRDQVKSKVGGQMRKEKINVPAGTSA